MVETRDKPAELRASCRKKLRAGLLAAGLWSAKNVNKPLKRNRKMLQLTICETLV